MHRHHQVGMVECSSLLSSSDYPLFPRYNNTTYRIDGIEWDKNPNTEFDKKTGEKISLAKYYSEKYGKDIRDPRQPLIISVPPLKEQREKGNTGPIYLVPELCNITGLSEEQRANWRRSPERGQRRGRSLFGSSPTDSSPTSTSRRSCLDGTSPSPRSWSR